MKTNLFYGAAMSLATAVLVLILFFAGLHSDPDKLATAGYIQMVAGIAITMTALILGLRARRAQTPLNEGFSYGRSFGNALMISLFAIIFGTIFQVLYETVINPGFIDVYVQSQVAKLEASGKPQDAIDNAEKIIRKFSTPAIRAAFGLVFGGIFMALFSLIAAAFVRRPSPAEEATP